MISFYLNKYLFVFFITKLTVKIIIIKLFNEKIRISFISQTFTFLNETWTSTWNVCENKQCLNEIIQWLCSCQIMYKTQPDSFLMTHPLQSPKPAFSNPKPGSPLTRTLSSFHNTSPKTLGILNQHWEILQPQVWDNTFVLQVHIEGVSISRKPGQFPRRNSHNIGIFIYINNKHGHTFFLGGWKRSSVG